LIAIVAFAVVSIIVVISLLKSSPQLSIELNPSPPITVNQGGEFSIDISVRNKAGLFIAEANNISGELALPEGFIEKALQTSTRQLIFGGISAGDASHYGLAIIVSSIVEMGEYHAELTIKGANIPTETLDIEITVLTS
jgi:hypothetical protein